jgi:hypothetical protein
MYYLITFAHSSPQQADEVSCAAFMKGNPSSACQGKFDSLEVATHLLAE